MADPTRPKRLVKLLVPAEAVELLRGASAEEQRLMRDLAAELIVEGLHRRECARQRPYLRLGIKRVRRGSRGGSA